MFIDQRSFEGLEWIVESFSTEPRWTREPDLDAIRKTVASALESNNETDQISFYAQGAFNKLYEIQRESGDHLLMRVSLPVDPQNKTVSEVATLEWVSHHTEIPVPKVICHDASRDNPIGFEWILMSKLPGEVWATHWKSLSYESKEHVVKSFCGFSTQIFRKQLRGIGNIHSMSPSADVGRIVSMHFFWDDHIHQNVPRGPFRTTRDWIHAQLALSDNDCQSKIATYSAKTDMDSDDEDDLEDAERTLEIIKKLRPLVDQIFPNGDDSQYESSMLCHDDLSLHNILVDTDGNLTGVVDWECVSALPLWRACCFPAFLVEQPRYHKPDSARYKVEANGEINELYWEHMKEYELTMLRETYLEEMSRLEPEWMKVFKSSVQKRDLDVAVRNCDNEFLARQIRAWADDVAMGRNDEHGLMERIQAD
ncbi:hypothetical protein QQX98_003222 [Neonectria punicea]|uniref:Aminoglycoside phosphotransferase domain-containing protein n=1 Tax=Neonectria punicea TaxID=979145 RepID=A0ABR1HEQ8_9HYPO